MRRSLLLLAAIFPTAILAADTSVDIGKIEGAYRSSFRIGDTSGDKYMVTDTLELLRVEKGRVYFSIGLNFFNGHTCGLAGFADSEKGALVYRDTSHNPEEPCELRLTPVKGRITFEDVGNHCRMASCGARGGYGGREFSIARRRSLTARERREALSDYKGALQEHEEREREKKRQQKTQP